MQNLGELIWNYPNAKEPSIEIDSVLVTSISWAAHQAMAFVVLRKLTSYNSCFVAKNCLCCVYYNLEVNETVAVQDLRHLSGASDIYL